MGLPSEVFDQIRHRGDAGLLTAIIRAQHDLASVGPDAEAVMRVVAERTPALAGADGAAVVLPEGDALVYRAVSGTAAPLIGHRLPVAASLAGQCLRQGAVLNCADAEADPRADRAVARRAEARSVLVAPLVDGGAEPVGVLKAFACTAGAFDALQAATLQLLAGLLAAALRQADEFRRNQRLLAQRGEGEERFRSAFEHAAIGMALVGLDGRWLKVNRALCDLIGYAEHELLATDFQTVTHPDDLAADLEHVRRLIAGETRSYQMFKRYVHKAGRVVWVLLSVSLVRDESGAPRYFISQIQDVTDRRRAEWLQRDGRAVYERVARHEPLDAVAAEITALVERQVPGAAAGVLLLEEGTLRLVAPRLAGDFADVLRTRALSLAHALVARADEQRQQNQPTHTSPAEAQPSEAPSDEEGAPNGGGGAAIVVTDIATDRAWAAPGLRPAAAAHGLRGCWSMPVYASDTTFVGLLLVFLPSAGDGTPSAPPQPGPGDRRMLEMAGRAAVIAVEHREVTDRLAHGAQHDPLTGLPNRLLFDDRLQQALAAGRRAGQRLAVMAMDVDHFKRINDSHGHAAGDDLLQQFALRVRGCLRASDTLARLGGDEFVALLAPVGRADDAAAVATRIVESLNAPFDVAGRSVRATGSIGVALWPDDGPDGPAVLRAADAALYRAKAAGRAGFKFSEGEAPPAPGE